MSAASWVPQELEDRCGRTMAARARVEEDAEVAERREWAVARVEIQISAACRCPLATAKNG